jgi:hypothetical protein
VLGNVGDPQPVRGVGSAPKPSTTPNVTGFPVGENVSTVYLGVVFNDASRGGEGSDGQWT